MKYFLLISLLSLTSPSKGQNQFLDFVNHNQSNPIKLTPLSSFVMSWYGVKYKLGGSTKRGIDCSQFTKKLYWEVYGRKLGNNCEEQWKQTKRIKKVQKFKRGVGSRHLVNSSENVSNTSIGGKRKTRRKNQKKRTRKN